MDITLPQEENNVESQKVLREVIITASFDQKAETDTRTVRGENLKAYWSPRDRIKVFSNGTEGVFSYLGNDTTRVANFSGMISYVTGTDEENEDQKHYVWGLYPYSKDATYSEPNGNSRTAEITTTLPSIQKSRAGSYDDGYALTLGRSETLSIPFQCAHSGFFVRFNRDDVISVTLKTLDGEPIAGRVTLGLDDKSKPVIKQYIDPSSEITVYDTNGGTFEPGKDYYIITLPLASVTTGVRFTVKTKGGLEGTYTLNSKKGFTRASFRNLSDPLDQRITSWTKAAEQGLNEIWYTTSDNSVVEYCSDPSYPSYWSVVDKDNCVAPADNDGVGIIRFTAPVELIDRWAFIEATKLTSVSLPETVSYIGDGAFYLCSSLTEVNLGGGVTSILPYAFAYCAFETIDLPESLLMICPDAFSYNPNLKQITIPQSVSNIGYLVGYVTTPFASCPKLEAFYGKFATEDHRCLVDESSYTGLNTLVAFAPAGLEGRSYELPSNVKSIAKYAFEDVSLAHVTLPEGLLQIQDYAFNHCLSLKELTIPSTVNYIGRRAFWVCANLDWIKIKNAADIITTTGTDNDLADCFDYTNNCPIYVPSGFLDYYKGYRYWKAYADRYDSLIGENEFKYTVVPGTSDSDAMAVTDWSAWATWNNGTTPTPVYDEETGYWKVTVKDPITSIPDDAFRKCYALKSVILPATSGFSFEIGEAAFKDCINLESVQFGESYESIYAYAFEGCGLKSLTVPNTNTLGTHAFSNNLDLKSVYLSDFIDGWPENNNPFMRCESLAVFSGNNSMVSEDGKCLILNNVMVSYAPKSTSGTYTVPETVTRIGSQAMYGAIFQDVILPDGLTSIGWAALGDCPNLSKLDIPASVTSLEGRFIMDSPSIEYVKMNSATPPEISDGAFEYVPEDFYIKIPGAGLMDYGYNSSYQKWNDLKPHFYVYQTDSELWFHEIGNSTNSMYLHGDYTGDGNYDELKEFALPRYSFKGIEPLCAIPSSVDAGLTFIKMYYLTSGESITKMADYGFSDEHPFGSGLHQAATIDWVSLPNTITEIGQKAFKGCFSLLLSPLLQGDNLTTIGDEAFNGCFSMVQFSAKKVKSLGESAFEGCISLETVELGPVSSIKNRTFSNCLNLKSVSLDNLSALTSIGDYAFQGNEKLQRIGNSDKVRLPNVETIGKKAFYYTSAFNAELELDKVKNISEYAFASSKIKAVSAPMLETVGEGAFDSVKTLYTLDLPSVVTLGNSCFASMDNLEQLTWGPNLTSIGSNIFNGRNNNGQLSLYFIGSTPPDPDAFDQGAFLYDSSTPFKFEGIYVPAGSKEAYRTVFESKLTSGAVTSSYLQEY